MDGKVSADGGTAHPAGERGPGRLGDRPIDAGPGGPVETGSGRQVAAGSETILGCDAVGDLGPVVLRHPPGTFSLTPASRIALEAVARRRDLLSGTGVDWGCGVGGLAILAARVPAVTRVVGLELSRRDIETARRNARRNGVVGRVRFVAADSFEPLDPADRSALDDLRGRVDFLLANPPASPTGDGFDVRRRILQEARAFLRPHGLALLQISSQYGELRIGGLEGDAPGFRWVGPIASTDPVPFDLGRPELRACLELYARTEEEGGPSYDFVDPDGGTLTARGAMARFRATGSSPLSQWQVHGFRFEEVAPDGGRPRPCPGDASRRTMAPWAGRGGSVPDGGRSMGMRTRVSQGIQAGLLAGLTVAAFFFITDLVRLAPLSTPAVLQQAFVGPGGTFVDFPVEARLAAGIGFFIRFVSLTILHFLAFAVLGIGASLVLCGRPFGACAVSGAVYGLLACTAVFYGSVLVTGARYIAEFPGLPAVLLANLLAGAVMGAYLGLASRPA